MIHRDELQQYIHMHLECDRFKDYAPNGLQVEGRAVIERICTAVSASEHAINAAIACEADALLVHHGYFWSGEAAVITGIKRQRIARLLSTDLNLYAYHLPLDAHATLGNNACLATLLCANSVQMHTVDGTPQLLWSGELSMAITADELKTRLQNILDRDPLLISGGTKVIQRIAWCSGAAQSLIDQAHKLGVDAYLSGEVSERTFDQAAELGLHYFACGHHATERYGIQALGEHLAQKFDLKHSFIDSDNPV